MSCHPLHVFRSLSPDTFPDPSDIHQLSEPPIFQTAVPSQPPHTPLPHSHFSGFAQVSPYTWSPISTPSLYPGQSSSQTYPRQAWSHYEYLQAQSQVHSTSGAHQSSTTSASASSSAAQSTNTRKRVSRASQGARNVRARTSASNKENPNGTSASSSSSTFPATPSGAGPMPSLSAKTPPPAHPAYARENIFRSTMQKEAPANSGATDVWFFISPSSNKDAPVDQLPQKIYKECPKQCEGEWLICRWCTSRTSRRGIWKNGLSNTTNIRHHLQVHHPQEYHDLVIKFKLKGWEILEHGKNSRTSSSRQPGEPFLVEKFWELLTRWIVVDDQSLNVVDCQELRDLLLYVGVELSDGDIPHRTKLTDIIFEQFEVEWKKMVQELKNSLGRISFTSDMWSRGILQGFMAITAHYMIYVGGHLVMRSRLIAFRHVAGSHDGDNMAEYFFRVLQELDIIERVGMITLDNASNNGTMMRGLQSRLRAQNVEFSEHGNRIRCFPHVINIAVKTALSRLGKVELDEGDDDVTATEIFELLPPSLPGSLTVEYADALAKDLVGCARKLVNACRASGKRRDALRDAIINIQKVQSDNNETRQMRAVVLLRDVDTRWSSTFLMIDRLLELYPAVKTFASHNGNADLQALLLSQFDLGVLADIRQFLKAFHLVQELASAQKTPCLAIVLPLYEQLIANLHGLKAILPNLSHAISSALAKIEEYQDKSQSTHMYAYAMFINPTAKLKWIEKHWGLSEIVQAKAAIHNVMLQHQQELRKQQNDLVTPTRASLDIGGSDAAYSQRSGLDALDEYSASISILSRSSSLSSLPLTSNEESDTTSDGPQALTEDEIDGANEEAVEREFTRWLSEGIITDREKLKSFDLIRFWDNESIQKAYPILFRLALDVLPVQASAVPCERAFSASKETDADRRSRMSPILMEVLQVLKAIYRDDRLDFTKSWVAKGSEMAEENTDGTCRMQSMSVVDVDVEVLRNLLISGNVTEVSRIIVESCKVPYKVAAPP